MLFICYIVDCNDRRQTYLCKHIKHFATLRLSQEGDFMHLPGQEWRCNVYISFQKCNRVRKRLIHCADNSNLFIIQFILNFCLTV